MPMTPVRLRPPLVADERTQLVGWLDLQRAIVHLKCEGLSDADAHRSVLPASPLTTAAGVVSHLRWVENLWFEVVFLGRPAVTWTPSGNCSTGGRATTDHHAQGLVASGRTVRGGCRWPGQPPALCSTRLSARYHHTHVTGKSSTLARGKLHRCPRRLAPDAVSTPSASHTATSPATASTAVTPSVCARRRTAATRGQAVRPRLAGG